MKSTFTACNVLQIDISQYRNYVLVGYEFEESELFVSTETLCKLAAK